MKSSDPRWNPIIHETRAWVAGGLRLQRPNGSVLHQLIEAYQAKELVAPDDDDNTEYWRSILGHEFHPFVIEHDWAAAFANSDIDLAEDIGLARLGPIPYPHCCFEFMVSGKRLCLIDNFAPPHHTLSLFARFQGGFWTQLPSALTELYSVVLPQFRAVLITLDSKVATTEIVRAPYALNRARDRRGKPPVFDYHAVRLAHRSRSLASSHDDESERNSPRLHFRRGHWRHFETFKTWINWMLVGDPDLGFIDKHYRL